MTSTEPKATPRSLNSSDAVIENGSDAGQASTEDSEAGSSSVRDFVTTFSWISTQLRHSVGLGRLGFISFLGLVGSIAMVLLGLSMLLIIQIAAPGDSINFRGLKLPEVSIPTLIALILGGGSVGAYTFYRSEQEASRAAIDLGEDLREQLVADLSRPMSRGWQSAADGPPKQVLLQVLVSGVREITMAAREVVRLVGPVAMLVAGFAILIYIDVIAFLMMLPVLALFALPLYKVNKSVSELNASLDESQNQAKDLVSKSIDAMIEGSEDGRMRGTASLRQGDQITHDRMLQPVRMRSMTLVLAAALLSVVLVIFLIRRPPGGDIPFFRFYAFIITIRLMVMAGQRVSAAFLQVTRRSPAVAKYCELREIIKNYRNERIERSQAEPLGDSITFLPNNDVPITIGKWQTMIVLVPKPPTRATSDEVLVALEHNLDRQGQPTELLGSSRTEVSGQVGTQSESYVASDKPGFNDAFPILVAVQADASEAVLASEAKFTIVVTQMPKAAWDKTLIEWQHLVTGVLVYAEGEILLGGSLEWARDNKDEILRALGREKK